MTSEEIRAVIQQKIAEHLENIAHWTELQLQEFGDGSIVVHQHLTTAWPVLSAVKVYIVFEDVEVACHIFEIRVQDSLV